MANRRERPSLESRPEPYWTVSVWNLASTVTEEDVKEHFETTIPGCKAKVSTLVQDGAPGLQATTVTFLCADEVQFDIAIAKLKSEELRDKRSGISRLAVDRSSHGMTVLAESSPNPSYE